MTTSFRTNEVDRARRLIGERFYANFMDVLGDTRRLDARFDFVRRGSVTVGVLNCGAEVRIRTGEIGAHPVDVPLSGHMDWPLVAALQEALVNGLLPTAGHGPPEELDRPAHLLRPAPPPWGASPSRTGRTSPARPRLTPSDA
ncbi:hypothetical protein [Streptomyces sp. R41]|uniref:Transcription regulator HTH AraC- type ligand binding domain-containing protein n=1 Tax=Streptomyces sp. R41 TaxID=3238632 RepID=A0AB39RLY4_9ACTN